MQFEWDEDKYWENIQKHGISFRRAALIFDGIVLSVVDTRKNYGEIRHLSIGRADAKLVAAVVHTDRAGVVRIISARPANRKERKYYDDYLKAKKHH